MKIKLKAFLDCCNIGMIIRLEDRLTGNTLAEGVLAFFIDNEKWSYYVVDMVENKENLVVVYCERDLTNTVTKSFKIYGRDGHRQRESFCESVNHDFSEGENIRIIKIMNSDVTGTNYYTILSITRNTESEVYAELFSQISDGIFENSAVGDVELIQ